MAKNGLDPSLERRKAQRAIPTFEEAARRYHETVKASWRNSKHADQWLSTLVAHAFPTIGAIRVDHIDAPTVQSVLLPIWLTLPETARRARQRVGSVLDFSHGQGWRATEMPRNAINSLMKQRTIARVALDTRRSRTPSPGRAAARRQPQAAGAMGGRPSPPGARLVPA